MSIEKHDLIHELPEYREQIHDLKMNNHHFARLFDEYHEVDHEVRRIEEGVENTSDEYLEDRKKARLHLKDQLYDMLRHTGE
jgi:uncharacterized protein YdcH (DUF465 family)